MNKQEEVGRGGTSLADRSDPDVALVLRSYEEYARMVDGSAHDVTVADVYTVRDGQIVRMRLTLTG